MTLAAGSRLGPYEVVSPLGAGGMGEVYRARDTKLHRDVAIKVLPTAFAQDPERLSRFTREAQVLASLNHPRIAHVYGIEEISSSDGSGFSRAIVMELVDGPTLADRIAEAPVPVNETIAIARQIADALDAAHERGIVHRDLKPANIKLTADGTVKVLDFGLAKAVDDSADPGSNRRLSPTFTSPAVTQHGVILGTAAYMSPEQARGRPVDKRADIWAFGVVLYEMLTGKALFSGDTVSDTIAEVLKRDIDLGAFPHDTPAFLKQIIARCLERDPKQRARDIGDVVHALAETPAETQTRGAVASSRREFAAWGLALAGAIVAGFFALRFGAEVSEPRLIEFGVSPPPAARFAFTSGAAPWPAISPDGRRLVFGLIEKDLTNRLWLRDLDSDSARPLEGTEGAVQPFWAPDSAQIAFFQGRALKAYVLQSGISRVLCELPGAPRNGSWGSRGDILFAVPESGLQKVRASGGTPEAVTTIDPKFPGDLHFYPSFLPDGERFLFTLVRSDPSQSRIMLGQLGSPEISPLIDALSQALYIQTGHILYVRDRVLLAQRVDRETLKPTADAPVALAQDVSFTANSGIAAFSASPDVLTYRAVSVVETDIVERDRTGRRVRALAERSQQNDIHVSPDGASIVVTRRIGSFQNLWLIDVARDVATRLTMTSSNDQLPRWSPDSATIGFTTSRMSLGSAYSFIVKGRGSATAERKIAEGYVPVGWTREPAVAICRRADSRAVLSAFTCPTDGRKPEHIADVDGGPMSWQVSSDGAWLLYSSIESGRAQVYARSLRGAARKYQLSTNQGSAPRWRQDMKEIYYLDGKKVMAVSVQAGDALVTGNPRLLFEVPLLLEPSAGGVIQYDTRDGERFYFNELREERESPITVRSGWSEWLQTRTAGPSR